MAMAMAMEESTPLWMVWASMSGWLTPAFLFLLLNLVIGTIALTSHKSHQNHHQQEQQQHPFPRVLSRGASMLERLKSFNFNQYRYRSDDVHLETAHPPPVTPVVHEAKMNEEEKRKEEEEEVEERKEEAEVVETLEDAYENFKRSQSYSTPVERTIAGGAATMRKVASEKAAKQKKKEDKEEDKEVDARADDFINRFRKQLQLQRLESLLRNRREEQ